MVVELLSGTEGFAQLGVGLRGSVPVERVADLGGGGRRRRGGFDRRDDACAIGLVERGVTADLECPGTQGFPVCHRNVLRCPSGVGFADLGDPLAKREVGVLGCHVEVQGAGSGVALDGLGGDGPRQPRDPWPWHLRERLHLLLVLALGGGDEPILFLTDRAGPLEQRRLEFLVEHGVGQFQHLRPRRSRQRKTELRVDRVGHLAAGCRIDKRDLPAGATADVGR
ncbi:hypothetical protein [Rhodococcus sp. NPDC059234]|uniref:hypothetical protein n=1 Tax=Rhodococcus sp. NPDC059234 TaxID=3346781 RepID=UPI003670A2A3